MAGKCPVKASTNLKTHPHEQHWQLVFLIKVILENIHYHLFAKESLATMHISNLLNTHAVGVTHLLKERYNVPRTGSPKFKTEFDLGFFLGYVLLLVSNFLFFIFFMYKLMKIKLMNLCISHHSA